MHIRKVGSMAYHRRCFIFLIAFLLLWVSPLLAQDTTTEAPPETSEEESTAAPVQVVPDLTGVNLPQAAQLLSSVGLTLGNVGVAEWSQGAGTIDTINSQSPAAGAPLDGVSTVDVTLLRLPNALLIYDDNDLTLKNEAAEVIYIDNIVLSAVDGTAGQTFPLSAWGELGDELMPDTCVQMWSVLRDGPKQVPECATIRFWKSFVEPSMHFWTGAEGVTQFRVVQDGVERGVCQVADGRCALYLPPGTVAADVAEYLYFVYSTDQFILMNRTSNRWLPLNSVQFANSADVFGDVGEILLAPGQCVVLYRTDTPAPDCQPVIQLSTAQPFWSEGFQVRGVFEEVNRSCLTPVDGIESVCIMQR